MTVNQNSRSKKVGYYRLLLDEDDKSWMLGAVLITDDLGKPEEFKVTYPVKPTLLQRQLYGDSLVTHVGIELCGKPLFHSLENKPDLLLVDNLQFLPMADDTKIQCPLIYVERAGQSLVVNTSSATNNITGRQVLQSSSGRFQPISVSYPVSYRQERQREIANLIDYFFQAFDLVEPFERVKIAIQALREQDQKFR